MFDYPYVLKDTSGDPIVVGRLGEYNVTRITIDCSYFTDKIVGARAELTFSAPFTATSFLCDTVRDGDNVIWTIGKSVTSKCGTGYARLHFYKNDALKLSATIPCIVLDGEIPTGTTPSDYNDWMNAASQYLETLRTTGMPKNLLDAAIHAYISEYPDDFLDENEVKQIIESYHYITQSALSLYATRSWVILQGFLTEHQSLSNYYTKAQVAQLFQRIGDYALRSELPVVPTSEISANTSARHTHTNKNILDAITQMPLFTHQSLTDYARLNDVPTRVSQLQNDSGYQKTTAADSKYAPKKIVSDYDASSSDTLIAYEAEITEIEIPTKLEMSQKVGYVERVGTSLNLYSDSTKEKLIGTVTLPSGGSGSDWTEAQIRSLITGYGYITSSALTGYAKTTDIPTVPTSEINANTSARHTHSNKTVLDGITSEKVSSWDSKANSSDIPTIPTSLKNPYSLTINGVEYDGSESKEVTVSGGSSEWVLDQTITLSEDVTQILCDLNKSTKELLIVSKSTITSSGSKFFYPNKSTHYLSVASAITNQFLRFYVCVTDKIWYSETVTNGFNGATNAYGSTRTNELNINELTSFKLTISASSGTVFYVYRK